MKALIVSTSRRSDQTAGRHGMMTSGCRCSTRTRFKTDSASPEVEGDVPQAREDQPLNDDSTEHQF